MRLLFVLPGLHRVRRGAEVVFESIAQELALSGKDIVTLIGSGDEIPGRAYQFKRLPIISRERFEGWPSLPFLRSSYMYEELTFAAGLMTASWRNDADLTVTCSYPYTNWVLRSFHARKHRPSHVFVTQNGDWPAYQRRWEARFFNCDGLVCTNPVYFERNREHWFSTLIPNGMDPEKFHPGTGDRASLGLPKNRLIILMVSALDPGKRVLEAMRAVARIPDVFLIIAGDGPLRDDVDRLAAEMLPDRFSRRTFPYGQMPELYRCADIFLHTTIGESFGNVYVEALASGLPIVAHDEPVTRWILEDNAYLVDTRHENALVDALRSARFSATRENSEKGVAFAQSKYSWRAVAARYRDFFAKVRERSS